MKTVGKRWGQRSYGGLVMDERGTVDLTSCRRIMTFQNDHKPSKWLCNNIYYTTVSRNECSLIWNTNCILCITYLFTQSFPLLPATRDFFPPGFPSHRWQWWRSGMGQLGRYGIWCPRWWYPTLRTSFRRASLGVCIATQRCLRRSDLRCWGMPIVGKRRTHSLSTWSCSVTWQSYHKIR